MKESVVSLEDNQEKLLQLGPSSSHHCRPFHREIGQPYPSSPHSASSGGIGGVDSFDKEELYTEVEIVVETEDDDDNDDDENPPLQPKPQGENKKMATATIGKNTMDHLKHASDVDSEDDNAAKKNEVLRAQKEKNDKGAFGDEGSMVSSIFD
ncbi:hypothetical protein ACA910_003235 [Epithemia clementina (nom. ined.)]